MVVAVATHIQMVILSILIRSNCIFTENWERKKSNNNNAWLKQLVALQNIALWHIVINALSGTASSHASKFFRMTKKKTKEKKWAIHMIFILYLQRDTNKTQEIRTLLRCTVLRLLFGGVVIGFVVDEYWSVIKVRNYPNIIPAVDGIQNDDAK